MTSFFLIEWVGMHISFVLVCFFISLFTFFLRKVLIDEDKVDFFKDRLEALEEKLSNVDGGGEGLRLNRERLKVQNRMVWQYAKGFVVFGVVVFLVLPFMNAFYGGFYFIDFPWLGFTPDFLLYYILFTILFNSVFNKVSDWINREDHWEVVVE